MAREKSTYYFQLNELQGASFLPATLRLVEYEEVSYWALAIITVLFVVRRQERQALLARKLFEWVVFIMPLFMYFIVCLQFINIKVKVIALVVLWVAVAVYTTFQMFSNRNQA